MAKKRINLKKRLDELRNEPAPRVEIQLHLDVDLFQALKSLSDHQQQPVERYIETVLRKHTLEAEG